MKWLMLALTLLCLALTCLNGWLYILFQKETSLLAFSFILACTAFTGTNTIKIWMMDD